MKQALLNGTPASTPGQVAERVDLDALRGMLRERGPDPTVDYVLRQLLKEVARLGAQLDRYIARGHQGPLG